MEPEGPPAHDRPLADLSAVVGGEPALGERDPYNRLLARGPRVRMEAEMVRDVVARRERPPQPRRCTDRASIPLQPPGIWNMPYNSDKWTTSEGEDRYRRSLYTFWRRTSPYPSFMTFDATSREFCQVRRVRTNTPLQALTLLNDPASFEPPRAPSRRDAARGRRGRCDRATRASFRHQAGAVPRGQARRDWHASSRSTRASASTISNAPAAAAEVLQTRIGTGDAGDADLAAWTIVANVLLNLDEAVTKQ